jgi:hypothetical protein
VKRRKPRRLKKGPMCWNPPSRYPASMVRELEMVGASVWNSLRPYLRTYCVCESRGLDHDGCLYGQVVKLGETMGWDALWGRGDK